MAAEGTDSVTIKATALLSIAAIWAATVAAVVAEPGAWWMAFFAFLATAATGASAGRRLGVSRLIAIAGTWGATALVAGTGSGGAWVSIMAFLATASVVYSPLRRDAFLAGAGIAAAWLIDAAAITVQDEGSWTTVFAALTAGSVAGSRRGSRGAAALAWWGVAGVLMVAVDGLMWLAPIAFALTALTFARGGFDFPRGIEWDLFDRDEEDRGPRVVN